MSEADAGELEVESAELEIAFDSISAVQNLVTNLKQLLESKTKKEEDLKSQVKQLEAVINVQAQIHKERDQQIGVEYIRLKEYIGNLVLESSEKSKRIKGLDEELARERRISRISEVCLQNTSGAGHWTHNQIYDSGLVANIQPDLEIDLLRSKKECVNCYQREKLFAKWMEVQQVETIRLMKELALARDGENRLKSLITGMKADLEANFKKNSKLAEELETERVCRGKSLSSSMRLFQGLDNSLQEHLAHGRVLNTKLTEAREENETLLMRIKNLESQISSASKTITSPRLMSAEMVKSLQRLHKLFLQNREHRKALAFQKRYLVYAAGLRQLVGNNTPPDRSTTTGNDRKSPRVRFRSTILLITSICRMKFLVTRWQTDSRCSAETVLKKFEKSVHEISSCKH